MTTTTTRPTTKRQRYGGYGLTEMRRYAREYGIKGRSTMDGHQLLAALKTYWHDTRIANEQAVIGAAKLGATLRHKSTGDLVRLTSEVAASNIQGHDGALFFNAEYVEVHNRWDLGGGWATPDGPVRRARYLNEQQARRVENGSEADRHMLWQYEAV